MCDIWVFCFRCCFSSAYHPLNECLILPYTIFNVDCKGFFDMFSLTLIILLITTPLLLGVGSYSIGHFNGKFTLRCYFWRSQKTVIQSECSLQFSSRSFSYFYYVHSLRSRCISFIPVISALFTWILWLRIKRIRIN